ncbi:MAG: extracellular solute-binding protein, partial [Dehalococcoidia bacterium]|nr:extracellular solute-binding protein [Dehalococcoidia bacterium]
ADLLTSGWTNTANIVEAGFGQPVSAVLPALGEKDIWKLDPGKYDSTHSALVYGMGLTPSLIINTDLVRPGEIQSWQDLLDPRWKDKMVMSDPRAGSGPAAGGIWVWSKLGEDFWKKLAAQRPVMTVSAELPTQQVALGEKPVAIFPNFLRVVTAITAGAPLQLVHLKEGTAYYISGVGPVKNAPHPNAALVFINWMFTKEGQAAIGKASGLFTIRKDVAEDWIRIRELRAGNYTLVEPAANFPGYSDKGAEFAKSIFGAR